ncbi:hypothetical protein FRC12_022272, partial [Ceratobasidium sp. 428]
YESPPSSKDSDSLSCLKAMKTGAGVILVKASVLASISTIGLSQHQTVAIRLQPEVITA